MAEDRTETVEHHTERKVEFMNAVAEAAQHLREMSEPWAAGETLKGVLNRVTRRVNDIGMRRKLIASPIKASRIEDLWRREARRIDAEEMDAIRAAHALTKAANDEKAHNEARAEYADITAKLAALEAALRLYATDEGRHALAALLASSGSLDRAVDLLNERS